MSVVANVAINIDGKQAESLLKSIQSEVEKLNGSFDQIPKKTGGIFNTLKGAATSAVGQLVAVTGAAFTLQKTFETLSNQSKAEAALRTLGVNSDVATESFKKLSAELQGQASVVELTTAAYDVASAGFASTADQTRILEAATKGAVGGLSDINTVGNAVTSVLNAYGLSAGQANTLVDQFIQTQNDGKIILAEYATQIGRLAPTANAAGVGIDELNAAIGTITAQGVPVEATFTGLNQALVAILKPSAQASALAKELGIDFSESGLRAKGFGGLLAEVAQKTGGSTTKITELFGSVDALKAVLPLISGDMEKFNKNLENQRNAAGVAEKAFKEMSNTLEGALKEVDTAFKNLVVAFKPVLPAIIAPFKILAATINLVSNNIKALAKTATFFATFVGVMNASVIATKLWAIATQGLALAQKAAGVAAAFLNAVMNPAGIAQVALALGVATGASVALGAAMEQSGNKAKTSKDKHGEIKNEVAQATQNLTKQMEVQDQISPKVQAAKQAHKEVTDQISAARTELEAQKNALEIGASITAARYATEKAFNDLQGQQLQRSYELATSAQQRFKIAIAIFNQQVAAANIERNQALENINLEQRKLELKLEEVKLKRIEIEQAALLANIEGKDRDKTKKDRDEALAKNKQLIGAISDQMGAQQQIAEYQKQAVEAQYKGKVLAAQTALEQKLTSDKIGLSQADALRLSNNLAGGVSSSQRLASDTGKISTNANAASGNFIRLAGEAERAAGQINAAANAQQRLNNLRSGGGGGGTAAPVKKAATGAYWPGGFQAFAKGGMVTKPTLGLVGEGGQPEYIVPQSKASNFARNVLSGRTGASAINSSSSGSGGGGAAPQINIQTGPVTQMNGANYVTTQQMSAAVKEGIDQTMRFISRDMNIRRSMGIA